METSAEAWVALARLLEHSPLAVVWHDRSEGDLVNFDTVIERKGDPANLDWNLLLADLKKLSVIVENEEEENTTDEKPAAPTVRQKQPLSNHSRL